jgi:hypothetical protein
VCVYSFGYLLELVENLAVFIFIFRILAILLLRNHRICNKNETQFTTKIDGFFEFHATILFCRFFLNLTLCMTKLRALVLCFSYFYRDNSVILWCWEKTQKTLGFFLFLPWYQCKCCWFTREIQQAAHHGTMAQILCGRFKCWNEIMRDDWTLYYGWVKWFIP